MTTHITLRLAWHNDGWNGRICQKPAENSYCVGCSSYPGEMIKEKRNLGWETEHTGEQFSDLDKPPACMYSGSTFSDKGSSVEADPPEWFNDDSQVAKWHIPPSTACIWPYEAMYHGKDVVGKDGRFDYGKRLEYANEHFNVLEPKHSLVFYYANYSNPFSDDENSRYILVGVARIKNVGETTYYKNCSERVLEQYKGFVWQRNITSFYPEQGVRLPYHLYRHKPDVLQQFVVIPEATHLCKYATKHVSDDQALGLLEQLLESVKILRDEIQDESENWTQRIEWLEGLIAELWKSRGAYPGMPVILEYLGLSEAIDTFRSAVLAGNEQKIFQDISDFCHGKIDIIGDYIPFEEEITKIQRSIKLKADGALDTLLGVFSRCALSKDQLEHIVEDNAEQWGIVSSLDEIGNNLYLLAEQYQGEDINDRVSWSMIDRAVIPSPDLFAEPLFDQNSAERTRSILLETLRSNTQQTFVKAKLILEQVNRRISALPEWKQNFITEKYISVDHDFISKAIYIRNENNVIYLYDRQIWDNERFVQNVLGDLLLAPDLKIPRPVTDPFWQQVLFDEGSDLAEKVREDYQVAIDGQKTACSAIFNKPLSLLTGSAGTGKSTAVLALVRAIKKVYGNETDIAILAPTGKATDRLRKILSKRSELGDVYAATIHSLLAKHGWLNPNMTFRVEGGKQVDSFDTLIIDESSMIDLNLMAVLFRAIDWQSVKRLVLVGDSAQLPPIGIGKVFADLVSYVRKNYPENMAELRANLRQLENTVNDKGNGILALAECFLNRTVNTVNTDDYTMEEKQRREALFQRIHEGGDVDKDLHVTYWSDPETLSQTLIDKITADLTNADNAEKTPAQIWGNVLLEDINHFQILSPVRGELHGTESINTSCQKFKSNYWLQKGAIDGITLFDKVIQIVNRPKSRPLYGYNFETREVDSVEIFNGEIGSVTYHLFDRKKFKTPYFHLKTFCVKFSGKEHININYGKGVGKDKDGKWLRTEKPEENLELGYAISVHKSQGSEFQRVYFVLPAVQGKSTRMMELIYTALTRAKQHCTILVQDSVKTVLDMIRPEQSALIVINSSLFDFLPVPDALIDQKDWYESGKIHEALTGDMVRSKSEVIIANLLHERKIKFWYEKELIASDGSMYLPDFTIKWRGENYFWEHVGMLDKKQYAEHWEKKKAWYTKYFPDRLLVTTEGSGLSKDAEEIIKQNFS